MSSEEKDSSVPREVLALLSKERLIVRETQRAVTPFGGIVVFVQFLQRIDLVGQIRGHMPVRWRSHNQIDPAATLMAFLIAVLVGQAIRARQLAARRSSLAYNARHDALSD